jgi:hypothetical protein
VPGQGPKHAVDPAVEKLRNALPPGGGDRPHTPTEAEKRVQRETALRLHNAGMTKSVIAEQTGIPYGRVKEEIVSAMRELADEPIEYKAMAQMSLMRDLRRALYPAAMRGDVQAVDRIMKVADHEAKLLGLYAPQRVHAVIGGGASEAEFAVVAEALLRRAGREVPRHIAAAAADARRQGVLPPAQLVVDGEAS